MKHFISRVAIVLLLFQLSAQNLTLIGAGGPPASSSGPSFIAAVAGHNTSGVAASLATSSTLNVATGDTLWAVVGWASGTATVTVDDGGSNSLSTIGCGGTEITSGWNGNRFECFYLLSATANATATFTAHFSANSGTNAGIIVQQARGATSHDTNAIKNPNTGLVTSVTSAAFTTTAANEVLFAAEVCDRTETFTAGACGSGTCTIPTNGNATVAGAENITFSTIQTSQTATMTTGGGCSAVFGLDTFK